MTKLRIVVADDHAVVRDGLKMAINAQADMQVVGEAGTGKAAVQQVQTLQPDVIVMDVSMPDGSGTLATEQLRRSSPGSKVLALSMHDEASYVRMLLEVGAAGYVVKHSSAETVIAAIRMVAAGQVYIDPAVAGQVVTEMLHGPAAAPETVEGSLSDREVRVLRLIAEGHTNREVASALGVSVKTVETYKARAMAKLGLANRTAIVRYAAQRGWLGDM
jgi:DNA-binding NarL/FixJ family response regulator